MAGGTLIALDSARAMVTVDRFPARRVFCRRSHRPTDRSWFNSRSSRKTFGRASRRKTATSRSHLNLVTSSCRGMPLRIPSGTSSRARSVRSRPDVSGDAKLAQPARRRVETVTLADAVHTESLTKYYGPVIGLEALDLTVARGEVYGFLGPNGAGKTTTIRILLDLVRATSGRAFVDGLDCRGASVEVRRRIGYLPAEMPLYREMSGRGYLAFLCERSNRSPIDAAYRRTAAVSLRRQRCRPSAPARSPVARHEAEVRNHPGADGTSVDAHSRRTNVRPRPADD